MAKRALKKYKIAVVVSDFNPVITKRLLESCIARLREKNINKSDITVVHVPGAFEIPDTALKLAKRKSIDGVVCLGAIVRGETYHYELVAQGAAFGIAQVALMTEKPVIFEVLAADTIELANQRSEENGNNKGVDAADTVLEMIKVLSKV